MELGSELLSWGLWIFQQHNVLLREQFFFYKIIRLTSHRTTFFLNYKEALLLQALFLYLSSLVFF
jgi:hypothetical protein